jgi:sortase A
LQIFGHPMPYSKEIEKLTAEELRQLLVRKQITDHRNRVAQYKRSGRVVNVETIAKRTTLGDTRTKPLEEKPGDVKGKTNKSNRWMDRFLLVIEIAAALGLVAIVFVGANLIRNLNQDVKSAMIQPTLTPTAMINAVVLPSGHTPPSAPGGAQPNYAEIPENLRPLVQAMAALPIPTAGPEFAQYLRIPAINVAQVIIQGDGWEQLKKGIGQHVGSVNPGQNGNLVLSGHDDIYGEVFRYLDQLKQGDEILVRTSQQEYIYVVDRWQIVSPTDLGVLSSTQEPTLTLISCYPYMVDNQRIVVVAHLQTSP